MHNSTKNQAALPVAFNLKRDLKIQKKRKKTMDGKDKINKQVKLKMLLRTEEGKWPLPLP